MCREEKIDAKVEEEKEPWSLAASVFKPRAKECDSRAFFDTQSTLDRMFDADWEHLCEKEKFTTMVARESRVSKVSMSS